MKSFSAVFLTISLIFVISCALKQQEIDPWLSTISGDKPPEINVTGKWRDAQGSGFFTWGEGNLRQEHNKANGVIGDYNIKGVVSGKIAYLVFLYGGTVYYTARLEMFEDSLAGNYFKARDKEQTKGYPMSLVKISHPTKK
jgi:hypothetical protein